jgi:signal transduction histidine kinase
VSTCKYARERAALSNEENALTDIAQLRQRLLTERRRRFAVERECEIIRRGTCPVVDDARERERQVCERRLDSFFAAAPGFMAIFDERRRIVKISDAGAAHLKLPPERIIGKRLGEVARHGECLESAIERVAIAGRAMLNLDCEGPCARDATVAPVWQASLFPLDGGRLAGCIGVDVSERKRNERTLREYADKLAAANRDLRGVNQCLEELSEMKSYFVSMAAHELKTPLVSIIGLAETLRADDIAFEPEERRRMLHMIETEGKRLGGLLDQMLDMTRLESGRLDLRRERCDIGELLERTIAAIRIPPTIRVAVTRPPQRPVTARVDQDRLTQVFLNLITNAIAYSPEGERVEITLACDDKLLRIRVRDRGAGIDPADLPHIFERFYRGKNARRVSGSGLGLAITQGIVRAHGGDIRVVSTPGEGSEFCVELPVG